jgi:hypothetical protein
MDTCAVEVGLLKKHPCGQNSVAKCANCEMPLCTKHAVPLLDASKRRTGKFMCAECERANRTVDTSPTSAPKPVAPAAKPAAPAAPAAKPAAPAVKPAATAPAAAAAAKAPAVAPTQPAGKQELKLEDTGPIEFTPTKK